MMGQKKLYHTGMRLAAIAVCIGMEIAACAAGARAQAASPAALRVDELVTPLGIDDAQPHFSWQIRDSRQGARQTAYRLLVASTPELLAEGKADVWDSGRISSGQSVAVRYAGPAIAPEKRYFWKVLVWDQDDKPEPEPGELVGVWSVEPGLARAMDWL
jgi:alpha-L-rhamnosidase